MTTNTSNSSRRPSGRRESSSIGTPPIQSSVETLSNLRRGKSSSNETPILYPNEVILESLTQQKNMNHYASPKYKQSEQTMTKKYTELLDQFFQTHQPSFIFEPLRKEYYWTNEPFDEEKVTRLDKLLHSTSFFIQSLFWYLRIVLGICITVPIEIVHTILAGLLKPMLVRLPMILADTLIKPLHAGLFNALILPIGILLWNTNDLLSRSFEPFVRLVMMFCEPCLNCFRTIRQSTSKLQQQDETILTAAAAASGDQKRSSVVCV